MTRHFDPHKLQFYITMPAPCPYLEDQWERKIFTALDPLDGPHLNNYLTQSGFRRSQNVIYRPACETCKACRSLRVCAQDFALGKSFKRVLARNKDITREIVENYATQEQYALLSKYLNSRHHGGGMSDIDFEQYEMMVEDCASITEIFEYRDQNGKLLACCITDTLQDGLSMVYSFFDIALTRRSLGSFMILDHLKLCQYSGFEFLYLGYWVENSQKMQYKSRYKPYEI
ncbi:MAG: arginyltransferase [Robiginitomaculum sp.]|nr:arginyltransferase [Robiginitomaculum sp.]